MGSCLCGQCERRDPSSQLPAGLTFIYSTTGLKATLTIRYAALCALSIHTLRYFSIPVRCFRSIFEKALACGAQGYLEKPCTPEALIEEILKLTRRRSVV